MISILLISKKRFGKFYTTLCIELRVIFIFYMFEYNKRVAENIVCSECKCSINNCNNNNEFLNNRIKCKNCIKEICCCITIHTNTLRKKPLSLSPNLSLKSNSTLFFNITKNLLPAAIGIEILCIIAAEIGENIGLYTFGFNLIGIALAYII